MGLLSPAGNVKVQRLSLRVQRFARSLWVLAGFSLAVPALVRAQEPNLPAFATDPAATVAGPLYVFEGGALDLDSLRKRFERPDVVILPGTEYDRLRRAGATASTAPPAALVESVQLRGTVRERLARLSVEFGVMIESAGAVWVPVRLDGLIVTTARDAHGAECALRWCGGRLGGPARGCGRSAWWWSSMCPCDRTPRARVWTCPFPWSPRPGSTWTYRAG